MGVNMKKNATFTKCTPTGKREGGGGEKNMTSRARFPKLRRGS